MTADYVVKSKPRWVVVAGHLINLAHLQLAYEGKGKLYLMMRTGTHVIDGVKLSDIVNAMTGGAHGDE